MIRIQYKKTRISVTIDILILYWTCWIFKYIWYKTKKEKKYGNFYFNCRLAFSHCMVLSEHPCLVVGYRRKGEKTEEDLFNICSCHLCYGNILCCICLHYFLRNYQNLVVFLYTIEPILFESFLECSDMSCIHQYASVLFILLSKIFSYLPNVKKHNISIK